MDVGRWWVWVGVSRWWVVIQVGTSVCVGGTEGGIAHTLRSLEEGKRKETEERDGKRARERGKRAQLTRPRPTQPHLLSSAPIPNPIVNCPPPPPSPRPRLLFLPVPKRPSQYGPKNVAQKSTRLLSSYLRLLTPLRTAIYSTPYCPPARVLLSYPNLIHTHARRRSHPSHVHLRRRGG